VVEAPRRLGDGRDEGIDVGPVEDDPVVRAGRVQDRPHVAARVQADTGEPDTPDESVLCSHSSGDLHGGCHLGAAFFRGIPWLGARFEGAGVAETPQVRLFRHTDFLGRFVQNDG
jgi:hypothetical protein